MSIHFNKLFKKHFNLRVPIGPALAVEFRGCSDTPVAMDALRNT